MQVDYKQLQGDWNDHIAVGPFDLLAAAEQLVVAAAVAVIVIVKIDNSNFVGI